MKMKTFFVIIFICLSGCKEDSTKTERISSTDPCSIKFDADNYLFYASDDNILFERNKNKDSLSNVHLLEFKEDSVFLNTKKTLLPAFNKDYLKLEKEFIILNTMPRTLGKNRKSTDFLTKYDKDLQMILKRDMNISKYPSGNSFIIGNDDKLFYITDGFEFKQKPKLVISQIDNSFNILNQKIIERQRDVFKSNPLQSIFIEDFGVLVVSDLTYHNNEKPMFKIEMFDLNLNKKWDKNLEVNSVVHLGYSNSENKIFLVTKKAENKISFWDYNGNKQVLDYDLNNQLISVTSNDKNIFLLENGQEGKFVTKIDFLGKKIKKLEIPIKSQLSEENTNKLIYKQNQLFLISINNSKNLLTVTKIQDI